MSLSATEAAFEGFRVVRRKPTVVAWWALAYLVLFAVAFALAGPSLIEVMTIADTMNAANPSPADMQRLGAAYAGLAWLLPAGLLFGAVLNTAIVRAVLRPEEGRLGYLRLGADEFRVLGATLLLTLAGAAITLLAAFAAGLLVGVASLAGQAVAWLVGLLAGAAVLALVVFLAIRFSLVVPATFTEKRMAFKESWRATKGVFWPLLGMAVIAVIMSIVVGLLGGIVALPLTLATGGMQTLTSMEGASFGEMLSTAGPAIATWIVVNSILSTLQMVAIYAPFAAAWRDMRSA
nr:hypothetical protein [uncultured Brevundimonas sp.]